MAGQDRYENNRLYEVDKEGQIGEYKQELNQLKTRHIKEEIPMEA